MVTGLLTRAPSATCTFSHAQKSPQTPAIFKVQPCRGPYVWSATCGGTGARYTDLWYAYWFWVGVLSCVCSKLVPTENPKKQA